MNVESYTTVGSGPIGFKFFVWYYESETGANDSKTLCESLKEAIRNATIKTNALKYKRAVITDGNGNTVYRMEEGKIVA